MPLWTYQKNKMIMPLWLSLQGIVNDQFCQIQALKSEEQPDAVVRLIDTYILDVERILSNLKSYMYLQTLKLN